MLPALTVIVAITVLALATLLGLAFAFAGLLMCVLALAGYGIGGVWGAVVGAGLGWWPVISLLRSRMAAQISRDEAG